MHSPMESTLRVNSFLCTPLREATLHSVPYVGPVTMEKLKMVNIQTAEQLVGQFMVLGSEAGVMSRWLTSVCDVRGTEATKVAEVLHRKVNRMSEL